MDKEIFDKALDLVMNPSRKERPQVLRLSDDINLLARVEGLPDNYRGKGFKSFESYQPSLKVKVEECMQFAKRESNDMFLIFSGPNGNGKTHLICAVLQNYFAYDKRTTRRTEINPETKEKINYYHIQKISSLCKFYTGEAYFSELNDIAFNKRNKDDHIDSLIRKYDLISIDDIQKDVLTDTKIINLFTLVNKIYNQTKCKLIISMNFNFSSLEKIHPAITSRLKESGTLLVFTEPDYRPRVSQ